MVPKDGGNRFSGIVFVDFTHEPWSWSNLQRPICRRAASTTSPKVYHISDFNAGLRRPDPSGTSSGSTRAYRYETLDVSVVDNYYDKNPAPYLYEAGSHPAGARQRHHSRTSRSRLTWQATSKDKVQFWFTNQNKARQFYNISANVTPDGAGRQSDALRAADHVEVDADADQQAAASKAASPSAAPTSTTATASGDAVLRPRE